MVWKGTPKVHLLLCVFAVLAVAAGVLLSAGPLSQEEALRIASEFSGQPVSSLQVSGPIPSLWLRGQQVYKVVSLFASDWAIQAESGYIARFYPHDQRRAVEVKLTLDEAQQKAEQWLRWGPSVQEGEYVLTQARLLDHGDAGKEYAFEWAKVVNDIRMPTYVRVELAADTGELTKFLAQDYKVKISTTPQISKEEAMGMAQKVNNLQPDAVVHEATLVVDFKEPWNAGSNEQILWWEIIFRGLYYDAHFDEPFYRPAESTVRVNAHTGKVEPWGVHDIEDPRWVARATEMTKKVRKPRPQHIAFVDRFPCWSPDGTRLLFTTTRLGGHTTLTEAPRETSLMIAEQGKLTCLVAHIKTWAPLYLSWSSSGRNVALSVLGMVYDLDLGSGGLRKHTTATRRGDQPAWDPSGTYIAMCAQRSFGDVDLFVAKADESLKSSRGQWRVARTDGSEALPSFSPDGKYLYYVHQEPNEPAESQKWELWRVKPDKVYEENDPPEKILEGLDQPERLSWFPDGQRLLVWSEKKPLIVDVNLRSQTPFNLPPLHDPDLPQGEALKIYDVVVNPNEEKIAFSGMRWSGKEEEEAGYYIYTCNLDGSALERVTPLKDIEVGFYQFPETGKSAAEVEVKVVLLGATSE